MEIVAASRQRKQAKVLTDADHYLKLREPCVASLRSDRHEIGMTDRHHWNPQSGRSIRRPAHGGPHGETLMDGSTPSPIWPERRCASRLRCPRGGPCFFLSLASDVRSASIVCARAGVASVSANAGSISQCRRARQRGVIAEDVQNPTLSRPLL